MIYPLASSTWGKEEPKAIQRVIDSDMYTMGKQVKQFEEEFAKMFGTENAVMVNSGSSANLLMLSLLKWKYKLTGERTGERKANIIVPVVGWSTTYFPIVQNGFQINFVDVDPSTFNISISAVEQAINSDTCAVMPVNLLGNSCDYSRLIPLCREHNLMLIEDNCESMGAKYKDKYTGTIGLAGSFSFFFSHHIQTMEGGMVVTDSKDDADYMRSMRAHGWVRDLPNDSPLYKKTGNAFNDNFIFATPGYNVRPLEMSGAIGLEQLKKFPTIMQTRLENKEHFFSLFDNKPWCRLQQETGESSWFSFGVVLDGELEGRRLEVIEALTKAGVQTRPLASRNFLVQPVIRDLDFIRHQSYHGADDIHNNGFFVGNGSQDLKAGISKMYEVMTGLLK